jgi:hypothetical protein
MSDPRPSADQPLSSPAAHDGSREGTDWPLDVCISYQEAGTCRKHFFTASQALIRTLIAWKDEGRTDILLTWGTTRPEVRESVEVLLRRAGVAYRIPQPGGPSGLTVGSVARAVATKLSRDIRQTAVTYRFGKRMVVVGLLFLASVAALDGASSAGGIGGALIFAAVGVVLFIAAVIACYFAVKWMNEGK